MLTEARHQFPLGRAFPLLDTEDTPGTVRPFGLRYAVVPLATVDVDLSTLRYDDDRQISVMLDGNVMVPAMRHTSTKTKTQTGDTSKPDTDEDATGT
jgi:putative ATP-grasp target RiPP